eukprot:Amastigsp_a175212_10.p3 type:complete len:185 gc:universal Amastigsp_a175212_10:560-6(-)
MGWHGAPRLLVPRLVTGLKVWHLRPSSRFYPKANFANVVATLPRGATVVVCFGEIDCREGFIDAVAKLRYDSIEDAIATCVSLYILELNKLTTDRGVRVIVHTAMPVLNETRPVVRAFNAQLVVACRTALIPCLDFTEKLLTDDGAAFRPEFSLDGTHASPAYIAMFEDALAALPPSPPTPQPQ